MKAISLGKGYIVCSGDVFGISAINQESINSYSIKPQKFEYYLTSNNKEILFTHLNEIFRNMTDENLIDYLKNKK